MPLSDLVDETLPKSERAHCVDYAAMVRAIVDARILIDAAEATEKTAKVGSLVSEADDDRHLPAHRRHLGSPFRLTCRTSLMNGPSG
jgi:hypothetical protein